MDDNSVKKLENVIISDHQSKCPNGITKSGVLECADMSLGKNVSSDEALWFLAIRRTLVTVFITGHSKKLIHARSCLNVCAVS